MPTVAGLFFAFVSISKRNGVDLSALAIGIDFFQVVSILSSFGFKWVSVPRMPCCIGVVLPSVRALSPLSLLVVGPLCAARHPKALVQCRFLRQLQ